MMKDKEPVKKLKSVRLGRKNDKLLIIETWQIGDELKNEEKEVVSIRDYLLSLGKFKDVEIDLENKEDHIKNILKDYCILDPANVCGIFPLIKRDNNYKEITEIDTDMGLFKKLSDPKITMSLSPNFTGEVILINKTKYSKEYIDKIRKMASFWFSDTPEIFMLYDKNKEVFQEDGPAMFVFDNKLCFVLAPRIETED